MTAAAPSKLTPVRYHCGWCRGKPITLRFRPSEPIRRSMMMTTWCCGKYTRVYRVDARRPLSGGGA